MTASIKYEGSLRTSAKHGHSGAVIVTDAPVDNHGLGTTFSPTDLVATALGSCILTIMGIAARNHDIDIQGATAKVEKVMGSDPRHIAKISIDITMPANSYTDTQRRILDKAAHHCPVAMSLGDRTREEVRIHWQ